MENPPDGLKLFRQPLVPRMSDENVVDRFPRSADIVLTLPKALRQPELRLIGAEGLFRLGDGVVNSLPADARLVGDLAQRVIVFKIVPAYPLMRRLQMI